ILDVGSQMLTHLGYRVITASGGLEGLEAFRKGQGAIDLVVLDMIMPGMGGREAFERLKEIDPQVKVLLSSGYSLDGQAEEIMDKGCRGFIQKPFSMSELAGTIRGVLDGT
ncbi:MAG TPA: response regulator, partial [Deltaproteobacteria bacterium]|nr:response regulator [Deltaproteobacteria bacterium]